MEEELTIKSPIGVVRNCTLTSMLFPARYQIEKIGFGAFSDHINPLLRDLICRAAGDLLIIGGSNSLESTDLLKSTEVRCNDHHKIQKVLYPHQEQFQGVSGCFLAEYIDIAIKRNSTANIFKRTIFFSDTALLTFFAEYIDSEEINILIRHLKRDFSKRGFIGLTRRVGLTLQGQGIATSPAHALGAEPELPEGLRVET